MEPIMDFGEALRALKDGKRVARKGWNGKGMWLFLGTPGTFSIVPSICMKTAQNTIVVGWLASQDDMLMQDWEIVDG